jgi:transposase InsO family protein
MRERGLVPAYLRRRRWYSSYAGETDEAPANLPLREDGTHDFRASAPNEKWVTDITEFRLPDDPRKVYLSPVVDLFDGRPVAWSAGTSPDAALANSSLEAACATLRPGEAPFCHSDRGCHYRWPGWKAICEEHGVRRSMSRKGRSPDNAACEGFFGRLKNEFFHGRDWRGVTAEEFMGMLDAWMRFYREGRLKLFDDGEGKYYDTIDGRRRRLGLAA